MENLDSVKEEAEIQCLEITAQSKQIVITNQKGLEYAAILNKKAKDEIKIIENAFKPHKDNAYKAHKDLCKAEAEQLAPFRQVAAILKPKILKYTVAQEEIARKELEAKIAKQRQAEAEMKAKIAKEREEVVGALLEAGDYEKAAAVMESPTPEPMAAYIPEEKPEKVAGTGTRKVWKARVLDASKVPDMFKIVDQQAIDAFARSTKGNRVVEGLEFYQEVQLSGK